MRDNIKIVKLTEAIIKLQRELEKTHNSKKDSSKHNIAIEAPSNWFNLGETRYLYNPDNKTSMHKQYNNFKGAILIAAFYKFLTFNRIPNFKY